MENCERFRGKGGEQTLLVQTAVTRDDEKKQTMLHLGSSDAKRILLHQSGFSPLKQTPAVTMDGANEDRSERHGGDERTRHWHGSTVVAERKAAGATAQQRRDRADRREFYLND